MNASAEARTNVTSRLGLDLPIVQGPFGGGLSSTRLAATVSNLGGLGSFGAHLVAPDDLGGLVRELKAQTDRAFAINLWVSDHDPGGQRLNADEFERAWQRFAPYFHELGAPRPAPPLSYHPNFEQQAEALLAAAPPVFSFVFGIPPAAILAECRRRDIATIGTATSLEEARRLDEAGVDLIVATGFEAGGHRPSFLAPAEESLMGTFVLTQLVADRVRRPVIAAGGIADARGVRASLVLGAGAAQIGTAFLACEESGTTDAHREVLFAKAAEKTALTRGFSGRLARGVRNRWVDELAAQRSPLPPFPVTSWFVGQLRPYALRAGRTDLCSLWAGQVSPNLRHRSASALMAALRAGLPDV